MGTPHKGVLYTSSCWLLVAFAIGESEKVILYTYTHVGLSALLVSTSRAMRRPRCVERAKAWLHVLFSYVSLTLNNNRQTLEPLAKTSTAAMGNITEQSVFGNYSQPENQVTGALLKILEADEDETLLRALLQEIGGESLPEKSIKIETQAQNPNGHSVPDGKLSCRYAFDIYIESKLGILGKGSNESQLNEHLKLLNTDKNVILIYITQDSNRPDILPDNVLWANWTKIYEIINQVHEEGVSPVLDYLIEQFYILLRSHDLYDDSKNRVIIVGGSWGESVALEYGFYACQADRSFKKAQYIAFYHQHRIRYLFKIEGDPISSVDIKTLTDVVSEEYFQKKEPHYTPEERTFYKLKRVKEFSPEIKNDKESNSGKRVAFTQNQTYTTYEKIMKAKVTSDLN